MNVIETLGNVMQTEINFLNQVSHNVSNLNTKGYRSVRPFFEAVIRNDGTISSSNLKASQVSSLKDGAIEVTGSSTDLAIRGNSWFLVNVNGNEVLTRDGRFQVKDGYLVDRNGDPVIGQSGAINLNDNKFNIYKDGSVEIKGKIVDKLKIVNTPDQNSLHHLGGSMFTYSGMLIEDNTSNVVQGASENSNTDISSEMLSIVRITRHIDSLHRAITAYDNVLSIGINQIGK